MASGETNALSLEEIESTPIGSLNLDEIIQHLHIRYAAGNVVIVVNRGNSSTYTLKGAGSAFAISRLLGEAKQNFDAAISKDQDE